MEESGSHQPTIGPHQGNDNPHQAASGGSQHIYSEVNPQQRGDREQSGQTVHTNRSQSRGKSHMSHAENEKDMQHEINELNLSLLLEIQRMIRTGRDLELRLVKPTPVMKSTVVIGRRVKVHWIRA